MSQAAKNAALSKESEMAMVDGLFEPDVGTTA